MANLTSLTNDFKREFEYQCKNNRNVALMLMRTKALAILDDSNTILNKIPENLEKRFKRQIKENSINLADMVLIFEEITKEKF